jgi:D-sedoheptulose 7-phosphate isomerase
MQFLFAECYGAKNIRPIRLIVRDRARCAQAMVTAVAAGNKVTFCCNGGSAADKPAPRRRIDGTLLRDRAPLPALALTVDTSTLTATGYDRGYVEVFARQLLGNGRQGDWLVSRTCRQAATP